MEYRTLGQSMIRASRLGLGLAEIGRQLTMNDARQAACVLNTALDGGVNFFDTAANYAISEELIGMNVAHRREEYVLSTKCGNLVVDQNDQPWSGITITKSIERSLTRMKTDHLDLVLLHSCALSVLQSGEVIQALQRMRDRGNTQLIGYSGDNEAAEWAVESGYFDVLETSFNLVDQKARKYLLKSAEKHDMGIIAKRPLANCAWGQSVSPRPYADEYFRRFKLMGENSTLKHHDPILLALGFVLSYEEVDVAITGTRRPEHIRRNIDMVEHLLPLDTPIIDELVRSFDTVGSDWPQMN